MIIIVFTLPIPFWFRFLVHGFWEIGLFLLSYKTYESKVAVFFYYPFNGCRTYSYISYFILDIGDLCCFSCYLSVLAKVYWFFPGEPGFYLIYFLSFSFSTLFMSALILLFSSICLLCLYFAILLLAFWQRNVDY